MDVPVLVAVEQDALGVLTVAAGAARLLIVGLQAAGNIVVNDPPNVGTVDAHAEGVGGGNDRRRIGHETVLSLVAGAVIAVGVPLMELFRMTQTFVGAPIP